MTTVFTLPQAVVKRLKKISSTSRLTTEDIVKQAVADRLAYEEWALEQIDAGLAEIKAGQTIPHDEFLRQMGIKKNARKAA